jgi:hypothetical protein
LWEPVPNAGVAVYCSYIRTDIREFLLHNPLAFSYLLVQNGIGCDTYDRPPTKWLSRTFAKKLTV